MREQDLEFYLIHEYPSNTEGINRYFFQLINKKIQDRPAEAAPKDGHRFENIKFLFKDRDPFFDSVKNIIYSLMNRISIERSVRKFSMFNKEAIEAFLSIVFIYYNVDRNISNREKVTWLINKDILNFLTFGSHVDETARDVEDNIVNQAFVEQKVTDESKIDKNFQEFESLNFFETSILSFLLILIIEGKRAEYEEDGEYLLTKDEQLLEEMIQRKFITLLESKKPMMNNT